MSLWQKECAIFCADGFGLDIILQYLLIYFFLIITSLHILPFALMYAQCPDPKNISASVTYIMQLLPSFLLSSVRVCNISNSNMFKFSLFLPHYSVLLSLLFFRNSYSMFSIAHPGIYFQPPAKECILQRGCIMENNIFPKFKIPIMSMTNIIALCIHIETMIALLLYQ